MFCPSISGADSGLWQQLLNARSICSKTQLIHDIWLCMGEPIWLVSLRLGWAQSGVFPVPSRILSVTSTETLGQRWGCGSYYLSVSSDLHGPCPGNLWMWGLLSEAEPEGTMGIAAVCLLPCNVVASLSVLLDLVSELMTEVPRLMVLVDFNLLPLGLGSEGSTCSWPPWAHFSYS